MSSMMAASFQSSTPAHFTAGKQWHSLIILSFMLTKQWDGVYMVVMVTKSGWGLYGGHGNQQWGGAYMVVMVTKLWGEAYHGGHHMVTKQWVGLIQ